jgi:hypothetical protein
MNIIFMQKNKNIIQDGFNSDYSIQSQQRKMGLDKN